MLTAKQAFCWLQVQVTVANISPIQKHVINNVDAGRWKYDIASKMSIRNCTLRLQT